MKSVLRQVGVALLLWATAATFWKFRIIAPATLPAGLANVDFFTEIYPMAYRASAMILHGQLPLWNPYQYCGHPFLATILYGMLYPLNFFYLLFPTEVAIEYTTVLHLGLAGFFTFLYARSIGLSQPGSLMAGVAFMLSGYELKQAMWFTSVLSATVWLPLALFAVEQLVRKKSFSYASLLGVAVGMPILSGRLQIWVYMMYGVAFYVTVHVAALVLSGKRREGIQVTLLVLFGCAAGLALSSVQLLPTAELSTLSSRNPGGLSLNQVLAFGVTSPGYLLREALDSGPGYPRSAYVGTISLLLIPLSLLGRVGFRRIVWFWGTAVGAVCVALTIHTPVFTLYRLLPTGTWFRTPQRILFLYAFAAAMLTAIGAEALTATFAERWKKGRPVATAALVLICLAALRMAGLQGPDVWHMWAVIVALGLVWMLPGERKRSLVLLLLSGLLLWELSYASVNPYKHPYHSLKPLEAVSPVFDYIKARQRNDRLYLHNPGGVFNYAVMPKQGTLRELYTVTDYEPLSLRRFERFFALIEGGTQRRPRGQPFTGQLWANPALPTFRLLGLMSVRFIVAHSSAYRFTGQLLRLRKNWRAVFHSKGYVVYQARVTLPRAYVASDFLAVESGDRALEILGAPSFDPFRTVVIEVPDSAKPGDVPRVRGRIKVANITEYSPDRVVVSVQSQRAGYLVLTDTFYPGWRVFVDGEDATIYRANYLFRGVPVESGSHEVVFVYRPRSFQTGCVLTLVSVLVMVIASSRGFARARRITRGTS